MSDSRVHDYGFTIDASITSRLSPATLQQISDNLWAADCQSCGRSLALDTPTLVVNDINVLAAANLHHPRCQPSRWEARALAAPNANHLSYRTYSCMLPVEAVGEEGFLPVLFVNPTLEQVMIRRTGTDWTVATMAHYRDCGLNGIAANNPVPDAHIALDDRGIATARLNLSGEHWEFDCNVPGMLDLIRTRRGVGIGITTAYVPDMHLTNIQAIAGALQSGNVALGWLRLQ